MKISPFIALMISFVSWISIGVFLLYKGLTILVELSYMDPSSFFMDRLAQMAGGRQPAILVCISAAILLGFLKGRFVLSKTVLRLSNRFFAFSRPMSIKEMYPTSYLILLGSMMCFGMLMKWISIPLEVRGIVDVAVGSALINGALQYFKLALSKGRGLA
ncbi:MAG: hypothetical protein WCG14_01985 [Chlamydiia bacterium]|jgi:hypothetical protein